jgi:hypothetical protein
LSSNSLKTLSHKQLQRIRWAESASFRSLSYFFSVRWNWDEAGKYVRYVLGAFEEPDLVDSLEPPTPGFPPVYSLVKFPRARERRFRLLYGNHEIASSDDSARVFNYLAHHVNVETVRRTGDFFLVHAGAVVTPRGDGLLLPGAARSGKTSLTAALVQEGFGYLSDEAGAIDPVTRRLYPYAKPLHLKIGVFGYFEAALAKSLDQSPHAWERQVRADDLGGESVAGPCEPAFVIVPRYRGGTATTMAPLSTAESVAELGRNAWNLGLYGARGLELLADLCRKARAWRLFYGDLEEAVAAVRSVCDRDWDKTDIY